MVYLDLTVNNIDLSVTDNSPTLSANQVNATYQWLDCDNSFTSVVGQTNPDFTAAVNGNYAVEISYNNCIDTTACYLVSNVALCQQCNDEILVFPNPVNDILNFTNLTHSKEIEIRIIDASERLILKTNTNPVSLGSIKKGTYYALLIVNSQKKVFKIFKM